MIATPFDDARTKGEEETPRARALGIATDINDADEVHVRRQQRCTDNVEHYMIQGACWYCERTQQVIDEAATRDADGASDSEHAAASSSGETSTRAAPGGERVGRALASGQPILANGQFGKGDHPPVRGPRIKHPIDGRATKRAARRMQKIIDEGNDREAVAAFKLLYGQPKAKPTVPASARQAPGVQLPTPPQLKYG